MPFITSIILRRFAGDGWKDFGIKPFFKGNLRWYLIAILVYPVATILIFLLGHSAGMINIPEASMRTFGLVSQAFALAFLPNLIKNIYEEAAWRGYLTPKVLSLISNDYIGHLVVGLIWGAWHIPYYLFFEDMIILQAFTALNLGFFIPLAIVVMMSWAFVYDEIRLLTNSIWPVVLMHAIEDAFLFALILDRHIEILPGTDWLISPMNGLASIAVFQIIGFGLLLARKKRNSHS